jgi:fibronectin-binding autotransporter adhesin
MNTRTPSTSARGVTSLRGVMSDPLRVALLASTALALASTLPAAGSARAQDATWLVNPASGDFFDANNWTPGSVPTGTASFGASNTTTLTLGTGSSFGGWTFDAGASDYTFTLSTMQSFTGTGITINGGSANITNNNSLQFLNTSTAGSAVITNNGTLQFLDISTAGNATITNNNGAILNFNDGSTGGSASISNSGTANFHGTSTAGTSSFTNTGYGLTQFYDTSTAGSAAIINNGSWAFYDTSSAGSAAITNNYSMLFYGGSTVGSATITNNYGLTFRDTATAGSATITNSSSGNFGFYDTSTAGSAAITNSGSMWFNGTSTAGSATFTNNNGAILNFYDGSTGGSASISNSGTANFYGTSTAGAATFTNTGYGLTSFRGSSTAGSATITNHGSFGFYDTSSAGSAAITNTYSMIFYGSSTAGSATITNNYGLTFRDTATAGSATITNSSSGNFGFYDTSTAGSAAITNSGSMWFNGTSTAGSASINNNGTLTFYDATTADNATITNSNGHTTEFRGNSTAGDATITNSGGLYFYGTSTAGSATIANNSGIGFYDTSSAGNAAITINGTLSFNNASTAGSANITNNGSLGFSGTGTAGSATITNNATLNFFGTGTAGNASITNNDLAQFRETSTAGSATILNGGTLNFSDTSMVGSATITNNGLLQFLDASTAGSATIANNSFLGFYGNSTAGNAALINNAGGTVDFSGSAGPNGDGRLSAGSIAGAGNYVLGAVELTVGSNNLSTEVSGGISGSGSLVKTGTGTLTLAGATAYTGGTTIAGGTLQFGNGVSGGSTNLDGSINVTGGALAIQAPTILNVAQNVTFGDNTTLSIAAGASSPGLTADSITIGNGVAFNISGITDASQLDMVLINTASGISGDFAGINVGGFSGTVDYLTVATHKSADGLQYLASYGLAWSAGNNLATGTFTLTNATDSFTVGAVLADQAANLATGWGGTSLTKAGAGTLFLTGENTYSGGTTISGGTLQLGNGGTTGSITGNVVNDGVLVFNRFDAMTFAGIISGSGAVQQIGTGTLTLTGTNTYTGGTTINGGTLSVSRDANLGAATGGLTFAGGTLSTTASFDTARAVSLTQAGRFDVAAGTELGLTGVVSGSGDLIKQGSGTLRLDNGANAYGNTFVVAGTLIGNAASISGNIANTGTLVFDQSANATYAGVLSGNGGFNKTGTALLNLTGDSSGFAGTTTVAGGALAVNGSLGGMLDVLTAGRLQGTGTVGNTTVSGTIAPGNSIGTINVAGNIVFNAGSIYEVEVNAAGQSDRIVATGPATINGGTVTVLAGAGNYAPQTQYTILTASGGRTGTFTGGVTSNLAFLDPSLSYDANNVYLTMTRNNIDFAGVGLTANQIATGGGVESLGWGNPLYGAVVNLSAPQAQHAFEQLSGEIHASARTALIEDSRFIRNAVNDRIRAAFDAVGASGTVSTYDGGKPVTVKANTDRFAVWGQAFGSWGHTNGDGNAAQLNRKTGGIFFGADAPVFDTWRLGAVAGYSQTSFDVKDRHSSGSSDNYYIGLYGGTAWGDVAFRTGAAYTWHDVSSNRSVTFPGFGGSLNGDYNAATAQMFGELAYGFTAGGARFEPFANLAYVNLHTDGFTEQGGAATLTGASANTDATFATLGLRASTTFDIGGTTLTAKGMAGWRHAFGDMAPTSTMRFAGGDNAFNIDGVPIARDAAVIEAGLDYAITPNATLGVSYGGQFGSGMSDQSARFNFNVKF